VTEVSIFNRYAAILVSIGVHAVAIAAVHLRPAPAPEPRPEVKSEPIEIVEVIPPSEPMTVALLPDHTSVVSATSVPDPSPVRVAASSRPKPGPAAVVASSTASGSSERQPTEPPPATQNPWMTMRKPEQPTLDPKGLSPEFTETFLDNSKPRAPHANPTERTAEALAEVQGQLDNPRWVANATPEQVTGARLTALALRDELDNRELKPDGSGRKSEHKTFKVKVAADGSAKIHDKANIQRQGLLGASFDVTDGLMRSKGIDPYSSYKRKVLDETREERVAMGKEYRTKQLAQTPAHVQRNLDYLWSRTTELAARKQALFEMWDDCAESGPEELRVAGKSARRYIIGFIRSKLPATSADAYTTAELERFNRQRKSQLPFEPY
jgi:hypothetical protein